MPAIADLAELIEQGQIDTVLCVLTDLWGRLVGKRLTGLTFYDSFLRADGHPGELGASLYLFCVDLDMEPLDGFALTDWERGFHDFRLAPDIATARVVPWLEKTALVICDAEYEEEAGAVAVSPRQILRRQLAKAREIGLTIQCASELEFTMFMDSYEDAWDRSYQGMRPASKYRSDYHIFQTSKHEYVIRRIRNSMDDAGISISGSKGEWGLGQQEINLHHVDALEMADRHAIFKNGVKEMVAQEGRSATFMAKWNPADIGSSFHLHSSAWGHEGANTQMPANEGDRCRDLSELGQRWVAGILATARDLAWLHAPFANSYRRYEVGSFAPTTLTWDYDNRTCSVRVVGSGKSLHLENRIPGADANPYLVMAANVAGLLYGIENRLEAPKMHGGNAYEAVNLPQLPTSLSEAVTCLRESTMVRGAFGEEVWQHLVTLAAHEERITAELQGSADDSDHAWEVRRYFERV